MFMCKSQANVIGMSCERMIIDVDGDPMKPAKKKETVLTFDSTLINIDEDNILTEQFFFCWKPDNQL